MYKYHKIEIPYKRDIEGSKKLIEGEFKNETLEFLDKYKIPFMFTEKIDGTNISIVWDGHNIEYYGRTEKAEIPKHLLKKLAELFESTDVEELFEQTFGETPIVFYGEGYGPKIQNGGAYRDDVSFILFDIYSPNSDTWLTREAVEDIAKMFDIDVVPILLTGTIEEGVEYVKTHEKSTFGTAKLEGIVGRPIIELKDRRGKRIITKIKRCDFVVNK